MRILGVLFVFLCSLAPLQGQREKKAVKRWEIEGTIRSKEEKRLRKYLKSVADSSALPPQLEGWLQRKQAEGFLEYEVEIDTTSSTGIKLKVSKGPLYYYKSLSLLGINEQYAERAGIPKLATKHAVVNWENLELRLKNCLDQYQNEGFPFASFKLLRANYSAAEGDSIGVSLSYAFEPGPLVVIDSISLNGKIREKSTFVQAQSGVSKGDIYRQKSLDDIPRVLNNSIYYQNVKITEVDFRPDNKVDLVLELEPKETSKLDILLGILPPTDNSQRLQFTGSIDVALLSSLRMGELLEFKFDKLTENSAQTHLRVMMPYVLRTPLRLAGSFDLQRQDEDFQNQTLDLSAQYDFSPFLSASFFVNNRNTRLLGNSLTDTTLVDLPQLDASRRILGIGLHFENLDYRLNPSRGLSTSLKIGLGTRSIRENVQISRSRPEVYENTEGEMPTREIDFFVKWYKQLIPRHILHIANQTYWLNLDNVLRNDQRPVGGSRSIRGFNENEFFTDFYSFFSLEYRLQLERNSYLFLFGDYAYLENNESNTLLHPVSTGIGMNYGTKAGIISISYAIGRTEVQAFQPARGRVHIGLINQF